MENLGVLSASFIIDTCGPSRVTRGGELTSNILSGESRLEQCAFHLNAVNANRVIPPLMDLRRMESTVLAEDLQSDF